ncbi:MAG TPA: hypothetical protein VIM84_15795 [Gemmatimonadales bacterium]
MPDFATELRNAIVEAIQREIRRDSSQRSITIGAQVTMLGDPFGGADVESQAPATFATSYDTGSGATTMGFMFDMSHFDGDDVLV